MCQQNLQVLRLLHLRQLHLLVLHLKAQDPLEPHYVHIWIHGRVHNNDRRARMMNLYLQRLMLCIQKAEKQITFTRGSSQAATPDFDVLQDIVEGTLKFGEKRI